MSSELPARLAGHRGIRTLAVLGVLAAGSLWSWRTLLVAGILNHAPPYRYSGDNGQGILFMKWLPFAIAHGMNPFFSKMMFAPSGINMLSNTSFLLPALVLSPVTVLFGPVASFDLAVIAAPVISAYALYWVLRRYRTGTGASLVASLFYGYSPYLMHEDPLGHFNLTWMFFPPLLLYLLDEIVVRRAMSVTKSGVALGALTVVEFFNSPEMLVASGVVAVLLLTILVVTHPSSIGGHLKHAASAGAIGLGTAAACLAYPFWFAYFGPQHVTIFNTAISTLDNAVTSPVWPSAAPPLYGPLPPLIDRIDSGFIGPVACGLLFVSCLCWRRYRLVPYAVAGAVISYVLTLGPYLRVSSTGLTHVKAPDSWLFGLPLLRNIQEYRFACFTDLFVAIAIAACIDFAELRVRARPSGGAIALAVLDLLAGAAVLAFPMLGGNWSQPVAKVTVPEVFRQGPLASSRLGTVAVVLPPDFINDGAPLVWQAVSGLSYENTYGYAWRQVNSSGLGSTEGPQSALSQLLGPTKLGALPAPPAKVGRGMMYRLRKTLLAWKVSSIVFAPGLPGAARDATIISAVVGEQPQRVGRSLLWTGVSEALLLRHLR
ncbi:MAG: hypothetical protein ACYDGN_10185 [Acidimicrobiales bacterium]